MEREKTGCRCPNDSMLIPLVAEVVHGTEPIRFYWCWSCKELFAFVGSPGILVAGFAENGRGGWRVFRKIGNKQSVEMVSAAVLQVGPMA